MYGFRQSVINGFPKFTQEFEGRLDFMYLDNANSPGPYVTTGIGNLIDPMGTAMALPWVHKMDGSPASQSEISSEWNTVKSRTDLAHLGGGAFSSVTALKLLPADIDKLVQSKILQDESRLVQIYQNLGEWPADAQLGLLSMDWAMGPAFKFPAFKAGTDRLDFATADKQSEYKGVGSAPRIKADHLLFENADYVMKHNLNREVLWYPDSPSGSGSGGLIAAAAPILAIGGIATLLFMNRRKLNKISHQVDREVFA